MQDTIPQLQKHSCQAQKSLEVLQNEVETLRYDLRYVEEKHSEDTRRLWVRIAALTVLVTMVLGDGVQHIMEVLQWFV